MFPKFVTDIMVEISCLTTSSSPSSIGSLFSLPQATTDVVVETKLIATNKFNIFSFLLLLIQ